MTTWQTTQPGSAGLTAGRAPGAFARGGGVLHQSQWRRRYLVWLVGGTLIMGMGVASHYMQMSRLKADHPLAQLQISDQAPASASTLVLNIDAQDGLRQGEDKLAFSELPQRLRDYKASSQEPRVIIKADGQASFAFVARVMAEVNGAGITNVALTSEHK